jgi:hypothetical protein
LPSAPGVKQTTPHQPAPHQVISPILFSDHISHLLKKLLIPNKFEISLIIPNKKKQQLMDGLKTRPLPNGWEMRFDQEGAPYFIDHVNKKSTYQDPRLSTFCSVDLFLCRENGNSSNQTPTKGVRVLPMSPQTPNNQNQPPVKQPTPPQNSQSSPGVPRAKSPGVSLFSEKSLILIKGISQQSTNTE